MAKNGDDAFVPEEEKRLVRKLDFWYGINFSKLKMITDLTIFTGSFLL